jgi:serine/threonine protein kinase
LTIQEKVGDGAFGEVFKGRLWGTDVAIKKLKLKDVAKQAELLEDLKREIAILSNLRHPNMVLYIGACTKPPNVCIITEWCDRGSLNAALHGVDCILPVRVRFARIALACFHRCVQFFAL